MAKKSRFPGPRELRRMKAWCHDNRGSVTAIAASVVQRDGAIGVNHSAVSRTLAGRERNTRVIEAFRLYERSFDVTSSQ